MRCQTRRNVSAACLGPRHIRHNSFPSGSFSRCHLQAGSGYLTGSQYSTSMYTGTQARTGVFTRVHTHTHMAAFSFFQGGKYSPTRTRVAWLSLAPSRWFNHHCKPATCLSTAPGRSIAHPPPKAKLWTRTTIRNRCTSRLQMCASGKVCGDYLDSALHSPVSAWELLRKWNNKVQIRDCESPVGAQDQRTDQPWAHTAGIWHVRK